MAGRNQGAGCRGGGAPGAVYRPRNPRASPLYRCVIRHAQELHKSGRLQRPVESGIRELTVSRGRSGYLALYRYDDARDRVLVLSIRHQREAGYI